MKLAEWIIQQRLTRKKFAERARISPSLVTALCDGTVWPGRDVAARIKKLTDGAVTPDDFLQHQAPRRRKAA